jgi:hypothetical protein
MTGENVMTTPIFDQLLREMAQRAEPGAPTKPPTNPPATSPTTPATRPLSPPPVPTEPEAQSTSAELSGTAPRRRHRAE